MPEQLPKHVKPVRSSPSVFNLLHRNSDTQLLRQAVKPCVGDLTGAKEAKQSQASKVPQKAILCGSSICLGLSSVHKQPRCMWNKVSKNGWENEENVEDEFSRGGVRKFAELR